MRLKLVAALSMCSALALAGCGGGISAILDDMDRIDNEYMEAMVRIENMRVKHGEDSLTHYNECQADLEGLTIGTSTTKDTEGFRWHPNHMNTTSIEGVDLDQWVYHCGYLYFRNGVVDAR
jgi:hypothetical protein